MSAFIIEYIGPLVFWFSLFLSILFLIFYPESKYNNIRLHLDKYINKSLNSIYKALEDYGKSK